MSLRAWRRAIEEIGAVVLFARDIGRALFGGELRLRDVVHYCDRIGVQSLTIVNVCAVFTGMVLALQTAYELTRFGAKLYVGRVVAVSFVRELGPVFTALMMAGRCGTGIAAELGAMRVGRQIDAMTVMGTDPLARLVAPRMLAAAVMFPLLGAIVLLMGIVAGLVVVQLQFDVSYFQYLESTIDALTLTDLAFSFLKLWIFGFLVTLISCYLGYAAQGGTSEIGRAATRAMVASSIAILVADFVLTKLGQSLS